MNDERVEIRNTPGGRLEKFRPKNKYGLGVSNKDWAALIGLSPQSLGEVLRDLKDFQRSTYAKIALWLLMSGYTQDDVFYFLWGDLDTLKGEMKHRGSPSRMPRM